MHVGAPQVFPKAGDLTRPKLSGEPNWVPYGCLFRKSSGIQTDFKFVIFLFFFLLFPNSVFFGIPAIAMYLNIH